ncbi:unnamed protein product [Blepharisma stoltei]|uniref:HEAT repeat domain-containing protein n=1 Tax=Blepharisma stoltei TaxID=1481888 RepID=A0AAU9KE77_9CILI|nr:unnamed protein product [Blepharisma stoltei]
MAELLPRLQEFYHQDLGYISRRTVLYILGHLPLDPDQLIPIFTEASQDRVPNIRLILCKSLNRLRSKMDISPFTPILQVLSDDPDNDVKYFALQALD